MIQNNSIIQEVSSSSIGQLECISASKSAHVGRLLAPNGNDITNASSIVTVGGTSNPGFLSLGLQSTTYLTSNQGVYTCIIPDENGVQQYLHIGIYVGRFNGTYIIQINIIIIITYTLLCLLLALPQTTSLQLVASSSSAMTLNCTSTGSPAQSVVWRKDGSTVTLNSSFVVSQILRNGVSATYDNILAANATPSDLVGVYSCIIHDSLGRNSQPATMPINGRMVYTNVP